MARVATEKLQKTYGALSSVLSSQALHDAVERAAQDKKLLRKAKANARGYLKAAGVKLPAKATVQITQARPVVTGRLTLCVMICVRVGPFLLCARICITIVVKF